MKWFRDGTIVSERRIEIDISHDDTPVRITVSSESDREAELMVERLMAFLNENEK